jgi:hypothetical protein
MIPLIYIILTLNIFWLAYLTFLFYKKNSNTLKPTSANLPPIIQKIKIQLVRYNPFEDVGGDQSFILCLLDNANSGVIITSLHSRNITRIYAKSIKNGESDNVALSREETHALIKTINS